MSDPLDDLLGEWADPTPPADFVDQVMAAREPPVKTRRRWPYWAAAAVVVIAAGWLLWTPPQSSGYLDARTRQSITLGAGSAVAEAGAELTWKHVDGVLTAYQPHGAVFYRLAPDQTLRLRTPSGTFVATGTCFEMEIDTMGTMKSGLMGAALGAGLTAAAFVTVYDGTVSVQAAQGAQTVPAGERARVPAEGPIARSERRRMPKSAALQAELEVVEAERDALKAEVAELSAAPEDARVRFQSEKRNLQNEIAELKAALEDEQAARRQVEGDPVAFPDDLPALYTEDGQAEAFAEILKGIDYPKGRIDAVDCSEYPCIVHGYIGQREPGQAGHRALFNDFEKAWKGHFGLKDHGFSWSSSSHKDNSGEGMTFSAVVTPKAVELSKETHAQMQKRVMLRQQQYREANRPE